MVGLSWVTRKESLGLWREEFPLIVIKYLCLQILVARNEYLFEYYIWTKERTYAVGMFLVLIILRDTWNSGFNIC